MPGENYKPPIREWIRFAAAKAVSLACLFVAIRTAAGADANRASIEARIVALEKALGQEDRSRAPAPPAAPRPAPVATAFAGEMGFQASPGQGDPAQVRAILELIDARNAPKLAEELGRLLAAGRTSYPVLLDVCFELDRSPRPAERLIPSGAMVLALLQLPMVDEIEAGRFAHYCLAATQQRPSGFTHTILLNYLVVFLRYHAGRFPDLELDVNRELQILLRTGALDRGLVIGLLRTLGAPPKVELLEPLLEAATTLSEANPIADSLVERNNEEAAGVLTRVLNKEGKYTGWKSELILGSLAKMSSPTAQALLVRYMVSNVPRMRTGGTLAFFSVPRERTSAPDALELLNSAATEAEKRELVVRLRQVNPAILEDLKQQIDRIHSEETRAMVARDGALERLQPLTAPTRK